MPWETMLRVTLEEGWELKLPSGRTALSPVQRLGRCSKQGRWQKMSSCGTLRVCATDWAPLKQGEVVMQHSFPQVTIALSLHGCWQGGGPHCESTAVISAFSSPGRNAFERKLCIALIILGLCWASLFKWVIRHRARIGLGKA